MILSIAKPLRFKWNLKVAILPPLATFIECMTI